MSRRNRLDLLCSAVKPPGTRGVAAGEDLGPHAGNLLGVLVIQTADKAGPVHAEATRAQLADFVLESGELPSNAAALNGFGQIVDRSQFMSRDSLTPTHEATVNDRP